MKPTVRTLALLVFGLLLWLAAQGLAWGAAPLAVLYPEVREPYLTVFTTIIRGIEAGSERPILSYPLPEDVDAERVIQWLDSRRPSAVIALGSRGFQMAKVLDGRLPVIVGAVLLAPNGLPGISMAADPTLQLLRLKALAPRIRRVFVVYSPTESAWLVEQARSTARDQRLELIPYPAADLREAVIRYRELIDTTLGPNDAVWLPMDDVGGNDKVVLPLLLEAAWNRRFLLFSNKPAHVRQGVLFSQYPDNFAMGRSLAEMAQRLGAGGEQLPLLPTRDLHTAVNLRTAAHLGLRFTTEQQEAFQLKFP